MLLEHTYILHAEYLRIFLYARCSRGTGTLITPAMVYINYFIIPIQVLKCINLKEVEINICHLKLLSFATVNWFPGTVLVKL